MRAKSCEPVGTVRAEPVIALGIPLIRIILAFVLLGAGVLGGCTSLVPDDQRAMRPIPASLMAEMKSKGMSPSDPILIRIFKQESELEVWKRDQTGSYALLATYPMCRWSGRLGPKTKEGDRQAPEGFYTVTPAQMNPRSQYYLSFDLGYPNSLEKALGYTGEAIMVHGACSSSGCFALSDKQVAEVYALAREAFLGGQASFQVQVFPFRMTPANMATYSSDPNIGFWRNLEEGYDIFEITRREPKVAACGARYVFNARPIDAAAVFDPLRPCPALEVAADPLLIAHDRSEAAKVLALLASPKLGVPLAYVDGGMHPIFREALLKFGPERLAKQTSIKAVEVSRPRAALADPYGGIPDQVR
jgi:murein L,D-transpeptidase YafK